eukprot:127387_1
MTLGWSAIAAITYFSVYTTMMCLLALFIWREEHKFDRTFLQTVWIQRAIYAQVIVHFYDTATDIGVMITWYTLYKDHIDYVSVDMAVFFWGSVAILLFYRFIGGVISYQFDTDIHFCCRILMIIFDAFIFEAIYESFKSSQEIIEDNKRRAETKRERIEIKKAIQLKEKELQTVSKGLKSYHKTIKLSDAEVKDIELQDIDPAAMQYFIMLAEAVFESMPQTVFQAVFLVRSGNDPILRKISNHVLVFLSLIASIFSITNRFNMMDKLGVVNAAKSLNPKEQFPGCVNIWYIVRIFWRFMHILCRFSVFSLSWIVLGGAGFIFYVSMTTVAWFLLSCGCWLDEKKISSEQKTTIYALTSVSVPLCDKQVRIIVFGTKWVENFVLLVIFTIFTTYKWHFILFTDASIRQIDNQSTLALISIGWFGWLIDISLFWVLNWNNIILDEPRNAPAIIENDVGNNSNVTINQMRDCIDVNPLYMNPLYDSNNNIIYIAY